MALEDSLTHSHRLPSSRGVSPVLGVVLLVALTALLASTVGAFALGVGTLDTGPRVATSTGDLTAYDPGDGDREQRVRIRHEGGPPVNVSALELHLRVERTDQIAHVVDLPVRANKLGDENVVVGTFLDRSHGEAIGTLSVAPPDTDGVWSAGDALGLRITSGDVALVPGDRVVVRIVHQPSGQIVAKETLTAR